MKQIKGLGFFVMLFVVLFSQVVSAKSFHSEVDGELEANLIWTNAYFKSGTNSAVMEFRVWFKHPPDEVFEVLTDTDSFKTKMNNYNDARTLTKNLFKSIVDANPKTPEEVVKIIGSNQISSNHNRQKNGGWTDYMFFEFNFPWPLKDRWVVQKVRVDESNAQKGEYQFDYKMAVGNFNTLGGHWELVPVRTHKGWTEFQGRYESDPGVVVPQFVTKKAMIVGFKKDIESYRKILDGR